MKILAITTKGREFLYKGSSAHKVSAASAAKIASVLNEIKYKLAENEIWHAYEVDKYDRAFDYAETQAFTVYKGSIREKRFF